MKELTWEEHEKEYCKEINVEKKDIYDTFNTYHDAVQCKELYEMGYEEGNIASLDVVKYRGKYYVIFK